MNPPPGPRPFVSRRRFLGRAALGATACSVRLDGIPCAAQPAKPRRILVAGLWHTVNIGDIAHGPGLVRLIERHLPGVEISLWPARAPTDEIREMLKRALPKLAVAEGSTTNDGKPGTPGFAAEIARCDLMIVASGGYHGFPIEGWRKMTRKPHGVFGVGFDGFEFLKELTPALNDQLNTAQFVYARETASAATLNQERLGVTAPGRTFCPDSTFGFDLRDEARAAEYLARAGLEPGRFICVIPMLRYAPHWKIYGTPPAARDLRGEETNEKFKVSDHAATRELITTWVRKTGLKVLACPEMTYEMELAKEQLIDPLPDDVKPNVVRRETFWMPDEAAAVYARAAAVVSLECHSPIIALANGTPAIHVRLPSETKKGQMFRDVGVGEWIHEVDQLTGAQLARQVLDIHANPQAARAKVRGAMERVNAIYREVFATIGRVLAA